MILGGPNDADVCAWMVEWFVAYKIFQNFKSKNLAQQKLAGARIQQGHVLQQDGNVSKWT